MTTKQIAELTGRTERMAQIWAKTTGEKIASIGEKIASVQKTGTPADYDLDETIAIMRTGGQPEAFISLLIENAKAHDAAAIMSAESARLTGYLKSIEARLAAMEARPLALPAPKAPKPRRAPMRDYYDGEARINRACRLSGDGKIDLAEVLGVDQRVITRAASDRKIKAAAKYGLNDAQDINYGIWRSR